MQTRISQAVRTYFYYTVALDGNFAVRVLAAQPYGALLATSAQLRSALVGDVGWHKSFEGLSQSEDGSDRSRR